jgi:hypothetical protein
MGTLRFLDLTLISRRLYEENEQSHIVGSSDNDGCNDEWGIVMGERQKDNQHEDCMERDKTQGERLV